MIFDKNEELGELEDESLLLILLPWSEVRVWEEYLLIAMPIIGTICGMIYSDIIYHFVQYKQHLKKASLFQGINSHLWVKEI